MFKSDSAVKMASGDHKPINQVASGVMIAAVDGGNDAVAITPGPSIHCLKVETSSGKAAFCHPHARVMLAGGGFQYAERMAFGQWSLLTEDGPEAGGTSSEAEIEADTLTLSTQRTHTAQIGGIWFLLD